MTSKYLRRYTDLPALIYLLTERKLTLLDPQAWDDGNDSYYLSLYRVKKGLRSVLALCFTQGDEAYHHWRVFAPGPAGICVRFTRERLLKAVKDEPGVRIGSVRYLKLLELRDLEPRVRDLPLLNRYAFEHENEFRVIYESKTKRLASLDVHLPLSAIDRITLSPWIPADLSIHVKATIRSIRGCSNLTVVRSTLIGSDEWKSLGESAV